MENSKGEIAGTLERCRNFRYWLILEGVAVGALAGVVIVGVRQALEGAAVLLNKLLAYGGAHPWAAVAWFGALAVAAVLVSLLLKWEPMISGSGIPQVEGEILGEFEQSWWKVLLAKLAGGLLSLGCGLSLGREGPSIQLGAMVGKGFSRLTKRVKTEEKLLITCGASAGLAAAFNAPLAGVLFSLEEIHKHFSPDILLPSLASAITADFVSRQVFGLAPIFDLNMGSMLPLHYYGHVIVLGIIIGALGVVYNTTLSKTQDLYEKIPVRTVRVLIPFLLAGVFGFLYPAVLGGGNALVEGASHGAVMVGAMVTLLFFKFVFSMLSFGSGAPGGIFLPLLVMGALIGGIYCESVSRIDGTVAGYISNFVILGMAGFFSAIVRAPVTGVILITEMTGNTSNLLTLAMVSLAAYLVPDILRCLPVYDQLLNRLLAKYHTASPADDLPNEEKVLVEGIVGHVSEANGLTIAQVHWPDGCLVVSIMRGEDEFVPRSKIPLRGGDKLAVLCDSSMEGELRRTMNEFCANVSIK